MLTILTSTAVFAFLIWLGNVLMFLNHESYFLIPCFLLTLWNVTIFYKESNCKSLERKDFLITAIITILFSVLLIYWHEQIQFHECCYLYLSTFISLILYADSIRFKSLI